MATSSRRVTFVLLFVAGCLTASGRLAPVTFASSTAAAASASVNSAAGVGASGAVSGDEWPQYLGPARDGVAHGGVQRSAGAPNCSYFVNWKSVGDCRQR